MKKLLALACAFVLSMGLIACGGSSSGMPADGTYEITADTDSSMFRVEACTLTVAAGEMTAAVSLPGQGFSRLYFGAAEDAASAPADQIYEYYLNDDGLYTFDIPVEALEKEIQVAAFGHRRDTWYDHTVVFHEPTAGPLESVSSSAGSASSSASADAAAPAASAKPTEGEHQVDVTLEGGTGRATVENPAKLVVADGKMTATIVWSSPNYDQMIVDGEQYLPVNTSGNSTFEIPVSALDADIAVQAETTAMSEPHMIDYTLHFDSGSLK